MLAGVLFDLDGTLVDIDGEGFLDAYVAHVAAALGPEDPDATRAALMAAGLAVFAPHPGRSNGEVFRDRLADILGLPPQRVAARMEAVDAAAVTRLRFPFRRVRAARPCVQTCLRLGLRVAVATTPIYRPEVIRLRLRWAGLDDLPWDLVTHSENMETCKPDPAYFAEAARRLGLRPEECLMVGDDPLQDGPAASSGMRTFLTEEAPAARRDLLDLLPLLERREGPAPAPGSPPA